MGQRILQIDAFTNRPFAGNPAAVCVLEAPAETEWMRQVALEMHLSETAFLVKKEDGFDLRWFTPTVEVELCGHATLASAHALWEDGHLKENEAARFFTASGTLTATKQGDWIEMDFPSEPAAPTLPSEEIAPALGIEERILWIGKNRFDYLVELASEADVRGLEPDFGVLGAVDVRGFIVTSRGEPEVADFVSRYFAPACGVPEDPVTGSAHCCLAPYWAERLGKSEMTGYQASDRGGVVRVRPEGERVFLSGQAVTVMRAELTV